MQSSNFIVLEKRGDLELKALCRRRRRRYKKTYKSILLLLTSGSSAAMTFFCSDDSMHKYLKLDDEIFTDVFHVKCIFSKSKTAV